MAGNLPNAPPMTTSNSYPSRPASAPKAGVHSRWVCLMYHDVLPNTTAQGGGPERFAVPVTAFDRALDLIATSGYRGCSVEEAVRNPGRPRVAITFDDGARSQFDYAVPSLRARGMTATFYVTTDWIGTPGFMTWDELRQMVEWGMSVQSHTKSHPFLSELDHSQLVSELHESKAALDRELSQETTGLAFPGGDAPARGLRHLLAQTGYREIGTSRWGINTDDGSDRLRSIRRCTVRGDYSDELLTRIIEGDFWLSMRKHPREFVLASVRSTLGPTRYSRWRRQILDAVFPPRR